MYQPYNNFNTFMIKLFLLANVLIPMFGCINLKSNSDVYSVIYLNLFAVHLFYSTACLIKTSLELANYNNVIFDSEEDFINQVTNFSNNLSINKYYVTSKLIFNFLTVIFLFDVIYNTDLLLVNGIPKILGYVYLIKGVLILLQILANYIYIRNHGHIYYENYQNIMRRNELYNKVNTFIVEPEENFECCICLDDNDNIWIQLNCQHIFHKKCGLLWFERSETCPVCRTSI